MPAFASDLMDRFRLDGAVAVITGGAQGIGLATGALFAQAGAQVVLADRSEDALADALAAVPQAAGRQLDVGDEAQVDACFESVRQEFGSVDVLINNAGIAIRRPATELSVADWNAVVTVNMTGMFLCARAAARHMLATGRPGAIVNTASIMGLSGGGVYPNISYQTTKGAIINMTRALAVEWAAQQIRVNAVAPTYVETQFVAALLNEPEIEARIKALTPMGRLAKPVEIATAMLFLASPAAAMVTGHTLAVDGGYLAQ